MAHDQEGLQIAVVGGVFSLITGIVAGIFALACSQSSSLEPQATIAGVPPSTSMPVSPIPVDPTLAPKNPVSSPRVSAGTTEDSIPASLVGRWSGMMVQYGRMSDLHYFATVTLEGRPSAAGIIGRSREIFPTVRGPFVCSYLLYVHRVTTTSVILSEKAQGEDPNCVHRSYMYVNFAEEDTIGVTIRDFVHEDVMAESDPVLVRAE